MTPEVVIRRPMVTQPPIEGNLDYWARPFHSELYFDRATFRLQPELRDSFHLLQIDIVHILSKGASTRPYLLRKELPPSMFFIDALLRHNIYPLQHMEEAAQSGCYSTSLPEIAMSDFGHRRICREIFTLDKWTRTLPVIPSTSEPSPPFESRIAISISQFRGLCHTLQTLTTSQNILTRDDNTVPIRSRLSPPRPSILSSLGTTSSYFSITHATLRTMFSLVGRRVEEGSFVINAKLFW
ncbi:hypothetical protein AAG906_011998 [Vitis piasezkii]